MTDEQLEKILNAINFTGPFPSWWITILSLAVGFAGLIYALYQIRLLRIQIHDDHERSRREAAINVMSEFHKSVRPEYSGLGLFLDDLGKNSIVALYEHKEFSTSIHHKERLMFILKAAYPNDNFRIEEHGNHITLSEGAVAALRVVVISNLNLIETAMQSAFSGVVDRDMLLEQFRPYFLDKNGGERYHNVREVWADELPDTFRAKEYFIAKSKSDKADGRMSAKTLGLKKTGS